MPPRNLWGELPESTEVKPPITILKEQAEMLGQLTKGVLQGQVSITSTYARFNLTFAVLAPALDYSYELLQARHNIELYPVTINSKWLRRGSLLEVECRSEEDFELALAELFSSPGVKSVIASLLSQSKAL